MSDSDHETAEGREAGERSHPGSEPHEPDATPDLDELLRVFLHESTLWPVVIVFFVSIGSFGAALLVLAIGDRNPFAALALLLIAGMSVDLAFRARKRRRLRTLAWGVAGLWLAAGLLAGLAIWTGIA
jgi:hypothetical protein